MYGINSGEEISHDLLNTYAEWDKYVAHLWYNFFYYCGIATQATVIEIAPGSSPKIAIALAKTNFRGKVYIVEPFADALELVTKQYKTYLPQAQIVPVQKTLVESIALLPHNPDFIVAHHGLDDMLISSNLDKDTLQHMFNWVKQDKLEVESLFEQRWLALQADKPGLELLQTAVLKQWQLLVDCLKPNYLILSQYPSLVFDKQHTAMRTLNTTAQNMLLRLKASFESGLEPEQNIQTLLNANKNYNFALIGDEVLNAKNWLLYKNP